ncbi:hypothetical protein PTTG_30858, partial [Puccinia triticina 1-1 BBBD Race 1]
MKIKAFVVTLPGDQLELRGCVFSRHKNVSLVKNAFEAAHVELTPIWNYNPSLFFEIPHLTFNHVGDDGIAQEDWLAPALRQCWTNLKPHQLTALRFLRNNESPNNDPVLVWNHPINAWLHPLIHQAGINPTSNLMASRCRGSILADDMGLGKTLTTLAYILATNDAAVDYYWADWTHQSAATL